MYIAAMTYNRKDIDFFLKRYTDNLAFVILCIKW